MNRWLISCLVTMLAALPVLAKKAPGYYITVNHDTVSVMFSITQLGKKSPPQFDFSVNGSALYFDTDDKLKYLSPEEVLEISAHYKGHTIRRLARLHPNKSIFNEMTQYHNGYLFLEVHQEGVVKVLSYLERHPGGHHRQVMLQYDMEPLTQIEWDSFQVQMAVFFKDHTALAEKIHKGLYTKKDLMEIVLEYNQYHEQNPQARFKEASVDGF